MHVVMNVAEDQPCVIRSITDESRRCVYFDDKWMALTGQTSREAVGFGWFDAIHPDDRAKTIRKIRIAVRKRASFRHEFRIRRRDGAYRWALAVGGPRVDETDVFGYSRPHVDSLVSGDVREAETALSPSR